MNKEQEFTENDRLAFHCEYTDPQAELIREYTVFYYPYSKSIEMYDNKQRRMFLRKTVCSTVNLSDFQLCTSIYLFGRSLFIREYADDFTKRKLQTLVTSLTVWVPEADFLRLFTSLMKSNLQAIRYLNLTPTLYQTYKSQLPSACYAGPCFLLRINEFPSFDPTHWVQLQEHIFQTLIKSSRVSSTFKETSTSLLVIKPHAVLEGHTFSILKILLDKGFRISELQMFTLSKTDADDFLEIYKGVLPEYQKLAEELASGSLIAVEVTGLPNPVESLRELCGPNDPTIAKMLRPQSLRAKFGKDKVKNAVHCTDLVEDATLESQFFFMILAA